jgi:excisionase family DNA binding protein
VCSEGSTILKPVLTTKEAAQYLKISPKTLDRLRREGKIAAVGILGDRRKRYRYRMEVLDDFLSRDGV